MSDKLIKDLVDNFKVDKRCEDEEFIDFLWNKFDLSKRKEKVQQAMQDLIVSVNNKTFKPEPDKELVGIINGNKKVSIVKDSPQRQWTILTKQMKDIEREEKGGFMIDFKKK